MDISSVKPILVGAAPLIAAGCGELKISETVNALVKWDEKQCKVSPGDAVTALIINILTDRRPLYQVSEFYEQMDMGLLFDTDVQAADLNDDALGRTLDRLYCAGCKQVFKNVALGAIGRGNIELRSVHADTTSISLYGQFEHTETDKEIAGDRKLLEIEHGHSKQHRPDLKQFVYGLVASAEGIPIMGDVNNGAQSDKTWNQQVIQEIQQSMLNPQELIYVADSALVTKKNLQTLNQAGMSFISRFPETFSLAGELKQEAWTNDKWQDIGSLRPGKKAASYATQSFVRELDGYRYRFIVVRSSALDKRKEKKIRRQLQTQRLELKKAGKALSKRAFYCRADAEAALKKFVDDHAGTLPKLSGKIRTEHKVIRPVGRPPKNAQFPTETRYFVEISVNDPSDEVLQEALERESAFILITNLDDEEWNDARVLQEYKEQTVVELSFRFLKHPLLVDGIYVQSSRRAEALAYVFLLALLVASYLQMKIRRSLASSKEKVELLGKRKTDRPTIRAVLDLLSSIQVMQVQTEDGVVRLLPNNVDQRALRVIRLAGYDDSIYTESK